MWSCAECADKGVFSCLRASRRRPHPTPPHPTPPHPAQADLDEEEEEEEGEDEDEDDESDFEQQQDDDGAEVRSVAGSETSKASASTAGTTGA